MPCVRRAWRSSRAGVIQPLSGPAGPGDYGKPRQKLILQLVVWERTHDTECVVDRYHLLIGSRGRTLAR
jgi:hypothetical protein